MVSPLSTIRLYTRTQPEEAPYASVSMAQARTALQAAGLLAAVDAAVAGASSEVQVAWEYSTELHRNSPTVAALASIIGLTDQQVDDLFIAASQIRF